MHTVVLITGGFDPLHSGHLKYIDAARSLGDILVVGVNSDEWLARKKGKPFMPLSERKAIIGSLKNVDHVIEFDDDDDSARDAIIQTRQLWPDSHIVFANGGDRTKDNIPEMDLVGTKLSFMFGVGGENKVNSSSWILKDYTSPKTDREWGYYRVLHEYGKEIKVKELVVNPHSRLSMQRHSNRSEHWYIAEGTATVYTMNRSYVVESLGIFNKFSQIFIHRNQWHQLCNETEKPLKIIEIQCGTECVEEDIERKLDA